MHLKFQLETMELEGKTVAVPISDGTEEFRGVIKVNDIGAFILELLGNEISEDEIIDTLSDRYNVDRNVLASDVHDFLIQFESRGLLVK